MSALVASRPIPASVDIIGELRRREPRFAAMGLIMLLLVLPTAFAALVDVRTVAGINPWIKPLKFQASLAAYLLTLAWFAAWLPTGVTGTRWYSRYSAMVVALIGAEVLWLMSASAYGVPSHFNAEPAMQAIYRLMGLFAIGLTSATLVYGVLIGRDRRSMLSPAFRSSLSLGLVLTFVLTVLAAGFLAGGQGHFVGEADASATRTLPVLGWARDGGDLRVAHFFATHAMQIIPAFGLIAALLPPRQGVLSVRLFAVAFVGFTAFVLFQAAVGAPFIG
ncbi:MAG: hypothetical protein ACK4U0_09500 [Mesorhizobium sp.]